MTDTYQCVACGQPIRGKRAHCARFCGVPCKQFWYRIERLRQAGRGGRRVDWMIALRHNKAKLRADVIASREQKRTPPPPPPEPRSILQRITDYCSGKGWRDE